MTKGESAKVLAVLKVSYPNAYKDITAADTETAIGLWAELFADESYGEVMEAVKAIMTADQSGFVPTIGKVKHKIYDMRHAGTGEMTAAEAWAKVKAALSRSIYYSESEFEKLPALCQKVVGSPSQLRAWATDETSATDTVIASNFMKSYDVIAKREKERDLLPLEMKRAMGLLEG